MVVEDAGRPVSPGEAPKGQGDYLTSGAPKDPLEVRVQVHPLPKHTKVGVDLVGLVAHLCWSAIVQGSPQIPRGRTHLLSLDSPSLH